MDKKNLKIEGQRIYLRSLSIEDATEEYCSWINNPDINFFLETKKTSIEDLKEYIKAKNNNPNCIFLGIFLNNNDQHIGNLKLEPINFNEKNAIIGLLIGDKNSWGKRYGTEAYKILLKYVFENLELEEILSGAYEDNKAALKVAYKIGFKNYDKINNIIKVKLKKEDFFNR